MGCDSVDRIMSCRRRYEIVGQKPIDGRQRRPRRKHAVAGHRGDGRRGKFQPFVTGPPRPRPAERIPRLSVRGHEIGAYVQVNDGGHHRPLRFHAMGASRRTFVPTSRNDSSLQQTTSHSFSG
jgi:hypothetical protein